MKIGVNTFVRVSPFSTEGLCELEAKDWQFGFDVLELAIEDPERVDVATIKREKAGLGLDLVVCGAFGPDRNICSPEPAIRQKAKSYLRWCIDAAAELGSPCVCGPMYSAVGKAHLENEQDRREEWNRSVAGIREMADFADARGVCLALEPLNRFETDMINTVEQGLQFIQEVGKENVGLHLDTFHMHLEEKSSPAAIRLAGKKIYHFHACENDRGVPGTGQVHWDGVAAALKDVGYDGPVVIESFTPQVKEIARAVCIWREIAPSQDAIARQGRDFLKNLLS